MMKIVLVMIALLTLSGASCTPKGSVPIIVHEQVLVEIPADFLVCAQVNYPNWQTLTDKQVAKLLVELSSANAKCHLNMESIKKLQVEVKKRIEAAKKKGSPFGSSPVFQP